MKKYVEISLETHLFFARIMKEHALFMQAGFVSKDMEWTRRADFFRGQFEDILRRTVQVSNHKISKDVLHSGELTTCFTVDAERKTRMLSGIPIDSRITIAEQNIECGHDFEVPRDMIQMVQHLNERAVWLLNGLIEFKEHFLREVRNCKMFTANYPSLIEHNISEAKLYREIIEGLMKNQKPCYKHFHNQEEFWNHIMMEHALFIRGLLDPSECDLIDTANDFAKDFKFLLEKSRKQDCCDDVRVERCECKEECRKHNLTLEKTIELRDFKAAGTKGILDCKIQSIIMPLLADHVLREANHYIRIQEHGDY